MGTPHLKSVKVVHTNRPWTSSRCPWTSKTSLDQTDEYTTLREISSVVTVTKAVTLATNPSNKLPLAVITLIAVRKLTPSPLDSTNLGEVIWTSNRFKDLYIKDLSEPKEGKIFLRLLPLTLDNSILTSPSEGVWPVISGLLFDSALFFAGLPPPSVVPPKPGHPIH